jgi:hypothetical protein
LTNHEGAHSTVCPKSFNYIKTLALPKCVHIVHVFTLFDSVRSDGKVCYKTIVSFICFPLLRVLNGTFTPVCDVCAREYVCVCVCVC